MGEESFIDGSPSLDEGWWKSILADEKNQEDAPGQKDEETEKTNIDWGGAETIFSQDQILCMTVKGFNRGGLLVEGNSLAGFIPVSHLIALPVQPDITEREKLLEKYIGQALQLKIIECVPQENRLVFSERAAQAEAGKRTILFESLKEGQRVSGDVTNVTDFGAFIDLGGVEGLVHISELSWGRVNHPGDVLHVGDHVEVLVVDVSPKICRVALSLKRLLPNPWEKAEEKYPVNSIVPAVITILVPYGAFARFDDGLEGLIHLSEIPLPPHSQINDFLSSGQNVQVRVLNVDPVRQRLSLSMQTM